MHSKIYFLPTIEINELILKEWWRDVWIPRIKSIRKSVSISENFNPNISRLEMIQAVTDKEKFTSLTDYIKKRNQKNVQPLKTIQFLKELFFPTPEFGLTGWAQGGIININGKSYRVDSVEYVKDSYSVYDNESNANVPAPDVADWNNKRMHELAQRQRYRSESVAAGRALPATEKQLKEDSDKNFSAKFKIFVVNASEGESRTALCSVRKLRLKKRAASIFGDSLIYGTPKEKQESLEKFNSLTSQSDIYIPKSAKVENLAKYKTTRLEQLEKQRLAEEKYEQERNPWLSENTGNWAIRRGRARSSIIRTSGGSKPKHKTSIKKYKRKLMNKTYKAVLSAIKNNERAIKKYYVNENNLASLFNS